MRGIERDAILYSHSKVDEDTFINKFSVPTPGNPQMYSRAFVSHQGPNTGGGIWRCSKDRAETHCLHIKKARDKLQQLLQKNPNAKDSNVAADLGPDDAGKRTSHIDTLSTIC